MTDEISGAPASPAPLGDTAAQVATTEPSTPPPTDEKSGQPPPDPGAKSPKVDGRLKRINELTYQLREYQRQSTEREGRLLGLIEQMHKGSTASVQKEAPKLADYQDLGQFIQDSIQHFTGEKKETTPKPEGPREHGNPRWDSEVDNLMSEGDEKYEDFSDLLSQDIGLTEPMKGFILFDADNRVDLAHHLATNQKEIRRLSRLSPGKQIAELTRMDDKFSAKPMVKKPSGAPPPVEPVDGTKADNLPNVGDMKGFIAARRKGVKLSTLIS